MERKHSGRKCVACKNCRPMFSKPVERSAMTARAVAPLATRHVCEKHAHSHRGKARNFSAGSISSQSHDALAGPHRRDSHVPLFQCPEEVGIAPLFTPVDLVIDRLLATSADLIADAQAQLAASHVDQAATAADCSTGDNENEETTSTESTTDSSETMDNQLALMVERMAANFVCATPTDGSTSPQTEAWFDAEEQTSSECDRPQSLATSYSGVHTAKNTTRTTSTTDAGSQTDPSPARVTLGEAQGPAAGRAPVKQALRKQKVHQGWQTLWSVDCTAKW